MNNKIRIIEVKDGIKIQAKLVKETKFAWLLDCEGDREWFAKSHCNFNKEKEELEAPNWLLKTKFPDETF